VEHDGKRIVLSCDIRDGGFVKKLLLFLSSMKIVFFVYAMEYVDFLPTMAAEKIESAAYQTRAKFGGTEYFDVAAKESSDLMSEKIAAACVCLRDPRLIFFARDPSGPMPCHCAFCYKKDDGARYIKAGGVMFNLMDDSKKNAFWLDTLQVEPTQRNHGVGTTLFLYTQYIIRQLAYGDSYYTLSLHADPFGSEPKLDLCKLSRFYAALGGRKKDLGEFYESLGGQKENLSEWLTSEGGHKDDVIFEWRGTPLKPWHMMEKK
jgi:GNAT superfamily N-acetyltransferase